MRGNFHGGEKMVLMNGNGNPFGGAGFDEAVRARVIGIPVEEKILMFIYIFLKIR